MPSNERYVVTDSPDDLFMWRLVKLIMYMYYLSICSIYIDLENTNDEFFYCLVLPLFIMNLSRTGLFMIKCFWYCCGTGTSRSLKIFSKYFHIFGHLIDIVISFYVWIRLFSFQDQMSEYVFRLFLAYFIIRIIYYSIILLILMLVFCMSCADKICTICFKTCCNMLCKCCETCDKIGCDGCKCCLEMYMNDELPINENSRPNSGQMNRENSDNPQTENVHVNERGNSAISHQNTSKQLWNNIRYLMDIEDPETCSICLEEFENNDNIAKVTNCHHSFHEECIKKWINMGKTTCPNCRGQI